LRTIAVLNQKGGVGKTTTTVNIAAALADMGCKVIVIDLDPQAHLTIHLGVEPESVTAGGYEVLTQSAPFDGSLKQVRPNLWLLGANINLVGAETELVNVVGREIILREAMQSSASSFDFCFIDCAPSLGLLSLNALAASQEVLIPLQPHFLALQGFGKLLQTVDLVSKRINRELKVSGVLLCMYDSRSSLPNEVRADIERFLTNARGTACAWANAQLLPTYVRRNIKLAEAPSYGQTIFEYDPACNGAEDYRNVARFFVGLPGIQVGQQPAAPQEQPQPTPVPAEAQAANPPQPVESSVQPPVDAPSQPAIEQQPEGNAVPALKSNIESVPVPAQPAEVNQQTSPPSEPHVVPEPQQAEAHREPVPIEIREISTPAKQSPQPVEVSAPEQASPQPDPQQTSAPNETPAPPSQPTGI
jgi:chromosome partitioning protein